MKELIKVILIKLGLFNIAKKHMNKKEINLSKGKNELVVNEELNYCSNNLDPNDFDSMEFSIRMQIHLIEKTLVKGEYNRINKLQLIKLLDKIQRLINLFPQYPRDGSLITEALGIFKTAQIYISDADECEAIYNSFIDKNKLHDITPHIIKISTSNKDDYSQWIDADNFISSRHSVRTFEDKTVDFETVKEIVELAMKCPSACNRQPCKVYYSVESEKIEKFKPNPAVTKDINNFLIVTVNKNMFSSNEIFQAWINGGIFLESLVMAIHAHGGMGSCLFQEIKGSANYLNIKSTIGIPENEDIVALIGFGYLKDEFPVIETHRKNINEVLSEF